jgi:hypothetical protein
MKLTLVKRGEGDLQAMKQDIKDALELPDSEISLNSVTKHIVIKVSTNHGIYTPLFVWVSCAFELRSSWVMSVFY